MEDLIKKIRNNRDISTIYGLRFDSSFKNMYKDKNQMKKMINKVFGEEILDIESFRDKELVKDNVNLKCGICDLIAETKENIVLLEMQNKNLNDFKKRLKRYVSVLYATQEFKEGYGEIKPIKVYLVLNYEEGEKQVLKKYSEIEKKIKEEFDCLSEIAVWNIKEALKGKEGKDYEYAKLYVLDKYSKEEALKILEDLYRDERYKEEVEKIVIYNLDIKTYQKLKEEKYMIETTFEFETSGLREEAKRIGLKEGREEGIREGRKEGIREGIKEGKLEVANQLFSIGIPLELIIKATGLSEQQISNFKKD